MSKVGNVVNFVLADGPSKGQIRPAIVVQDWGTTDPHASVNLQVFLDGANDGSPHLGTQWITSAGFNADGTTPRTWHYREAP